MSTHWFPGHMAKAITAIKAVRKQIDCVIEVVDARLPDHTRNPVIDAIFLEKPRLILLNKEDLADPHVTAQWIAHFTAKGHIAIGVNALKLSGKNAIVSAIAKIKPVETKAYSFMVNVPTKAIVVGIPNVGKSTVINQLIGKSKAKTANKPGVTRDLYWIKGEGNIELLDSPGILWPKFEDPNTTHLLGCINCIPDIHIEPQALTYYMCDFLQQNYPGLIVKHFDLEGSFETSEDLLTAIARKRGFLRGGIEIDEDRLYITFLREFHTGKIGRISLTKPS